jgi:hypothetical protein
MSEFHQKAAQLSPQLYQQFKQVVETGKWPDGRALSNEQQEIVMQSIIIYENAHINPAEHTAAISDQCASRSENEAQPINIKEQ